MSINQYLNSLLAKAHLKPTGGEWQTACDSYGKVQHSRKYDCVYTVVNEGNGERIVTIAARIENHSDAKIIAAAKDLYKALKQFNHVPHSEGYCICPRNNGQAPDETHSTACADARLAIRHAESNWADWRCDKSAIDVGQLPAEVEY